MKTLKNLWSNFKIQPDVWFFYGFLLTFTLSIRKVIFFYPIQGEFNEYTGIYLYLSDIFLFLVLISWGMIILYNKKEYLSTYTHQIGLNKALFWILLLFILWIFTSIFWANHQLIAFFRALKILEFGLLFSYIILRITPSQPARQESLNNQEYKDKANISLNPPFTKGANQDVPLQYKCSTWNILRGGCGTFSGAGVEHCIHPLLF